jgi:hypothetical protein
VSVLGTRASGMVISERLRPGGAVQREMSRRTTGCSGIACTRASRRATSWRRRCRLSIPT